MYIVTLLQTNQYDACWLYVGFCSRRYYLAHMAGLLTLKSWLTVIRLRPVQSSHTCPEITENVLSLTDFVLTNKSEQVD